MIFSDLVICPFLMEGHNSCLQKIYLTNEFTDLQEGA